MNGECKLLENKEATTKNYVSYRSGFPCPTIGTMHCECKTLDHVAKHSIWLSVPIVVSHVWSQSKIFSKLSK